jgi:hypothetical protein
LEKYFKNVWTLEWKDELSIFRRILIMSILLSPFLLLLLYIIFK